MTDLLQQAEDEAHMRRALMLAEMGRGFVEPNPMVGAVLVKDGRVIGEGFHARFGEAHAELNAIYDCERRGNSPDGTICYVTLEPSVFESAKLPAGTQTLIEAGVKRVVTAMKNPNPQSMDKGLAALKEAGIEVDCGLLEEESRRINKAFLKRVEVGLPWVVAKWAQTLDGCIATRAGHSKWISNDLSRRQVHEVRARNDAIIVGVRTVLMDDPMLTARGVSAARSAVRVVIDPQLRTPADSKLIKSIADEAPEVLIATSESAVNDRLEERQALINAGATIWTIPSLSDFESEQDSDAGLKQKLNLKELFTRLAREKAVSHAMVEGGSTLLGSLLEQDLVDQLLVFVAPKILGDQNAVRSVVGLNPGELQAATELQLHKVDRLGDDIVLEYRVHWHANSGIRQ